MPAGHVCHGRSSALARAERKYDLWERTQREVNSYAYELVGLARAAGRRGTQGSAGQDGHSRSGAGRGTWYAKGTCSRKHLQLAETLHVTTPSMSAEEGK